MSCYRTSDNKFEDRPACMMQGKGRDLTDFRPNCTMNSLIIAQNNIHSNGIYRQFLQNNAEKIIEQNHNELCRRLGCDCGQGYPASQCAYTNPFYGNNEQKLVRLTVPGGAEPPTGVRQIS